MARAEYVADRVRQWFAERPEWLQRELISRAWAEHIDLLAWYWSGPVQATGIRGVHRETYPGATGLFFVLEPEWSNEP